MCDYRRARGTDGPLFVGPRHPCAVGAGLSDGARGPRPPTGSTSCRARRRHTPTPAISHAILTYNRGRPTGLADGIVITPSHNPPEDGGFKYNPPKGGPADTDVTGWIRTRPMNCSGRDCRRRYRTAWAQLARGRELRLPSRTTSTTSARSSTWTAIASSGLRSASIRSAGRRVAYWPPIAERYGLD